MIDWTKPVETDDHNHLPVEILFDKDKVPRYVEINGAPYHLDTDEAVCWSYSSVLMLRNVRPKKVKREGWVNVYPGCNMGYKVWPSEDIAKVVATTGCVATTRIEWEQTND
jgi:hypothetical protein